MPLDLTKLTPEARAAALKRGAQVTPTAALSQARKTLSALGTHGAKLTAFGFTADNAALLQDSRDALDAAGVGRVVKRVSKSVLSGARAGALARGRDLRLQAVAMLQAARLALENDASAEAPAARLETETALAYHSVAPTTPDAMIEQLGSLLAVLNDKKVAEVVKDRGGPQLALDLTAQITALRGVTQATAVPRGTPVETETLRVISGLIVGLARSARVAACAAAKQLREPSVAKAFRLSALYRRGSDKAAEPTPPAEVPPSKPEEAPADLPQGKPQA
jgi:hypothetical protein